MKKCEYNLEHRVWHIKLKNVVLHSNESSKAISATGEIKKPQHPKQNPKVNEYSCRVMKPHSARLLALRLWNICSWGFSPEELTELLTCSFLLYYSVWEESLLLLSGMEDYGGAILEILEYVTQNFSSITESGAMIGFRVWRFWK